MKKALKNWFLNSGSAFDSDAQAFFTAAGIMDAGEKAAWTNTVIALKAASMWIGNIFYPLLGTTVAQKKYNAVDPRDLDAANRLNFQGGWTYNTLGILGNGINNYADTYFRPDTGFANDIGTFGIFSLTSNGLGAYDMSSSSGNGSAYFVGIIVRYSNDNFYAGMGSNSFACVMSNLDGKGLYGVTRKDGTTTESFKNGIKVKSIADANLRTTTTITIGASNDDNNGIIYNSSRQFGFAFIIPLGLTEAQHLTFYNIINDNFLTPLGRV